MNLLPAPLEDLTSQIARLPGIGPKSAQKLAFYFANLAPAEVTPLLTAVDRVTRELRPCTRCYFVADSLLCRICQSPKRDQSLLVVVENNQDVVALESSGEYAGLYFVLGGSLSPLDGIGPNELHIRELLLRLRQGDIQEVILGLDNDVEGDSTAYFLGEKITPTGVKVTRLASGISAGAGVQSADASTLGRALLGRR